MLTQKTIFIILGYSGKEDTASNNNFLLHLVLWNRHCFLDLKLVLFLSVYYDFNHFWN